MKKIFLLVIIYFVSFMSIYAETNSKIENYVFVNRDREKIHEESFIKNSGITGAEIKYTWKELEKEKDVYDFKNIREDYEFLNKNGKKLFVQLQDVSFDDSIINVPKYIVDANGAVRQYSFKDDNDSGMQYAGWVSKRWDPKVQERLYVIATKLAKEFDGKIEGIVLPETALEFGSTGKYYPEGFSNESYKDAVIKNLIEFKKVFKNTKVVQYANFMPGEWLPWTDKHYLASVFEAAEKNGVGVGGPDLIPYRKGQMNNSYKFIAEAKNIFKGMAVQDGNLSSINENTKKIMTVEDVYTFAKDYLHLNAIFWGMEEPYFSKQVIPFINKEALQQ